MACKNEHLAKLETSLIDDSGLADLGPNNVDANSVGACVGNPT